MIYNICYVYYNIHIMYYSAGLGPGPSFNCIRACSSLEQGWSIANSAVEVLPQPKARLEHVSCKNAGLTLNPKP